MANISTSLKKHSLHLFIDINLPETTTLDINQASLQEAIRRLFQNNLRALSGNSPEDILLRLGLPAKNEIKALALQKGKWAKVVEHLEKNAMGKEAAKEFEKGRKAFRETFAIGDTFNEK